jgi:hypothetical protein
MTRPPILAIDTLDDRREVWHLLHRLPPARRVAFLADCCSRVRDCRGNRPVPSARMAPALAAARRCDRADHRLTTMLYTDLLMLAAQWGLDPAAAAVRLEAWVRRPAASACTA